MQVIDLKQLMQTPLITPPTETSPVIKDGTYLDPINKPPNQQWLTLTREQCLERLHRQQLSYINFAHWLAIPSINLMLVFKHGKCQLIEQDLIGL